MSQEPTSSLFSTRPIVEMFLVAPVSVRIVWRLPTSPTAPSVLSSESTFFDVRETGVASICSHHRRTYIAAADEAVTVVFETSDCGSVAAESTRKSNSLRVRSSEPVKRRWS